MFKNRWLDILMALAFVAAVGFTFTTRNASTQLAPSSPDFSDYGLRHLGSTIGIAAGASDWFERHPEEMKALSADLSDYYLRHLGSIVENGAGATDWFERHSVMAETINVDLADYFQRHADPIKSSSSDSSDWFDRHPNLLAQ